MRLILLIVIIALSCLDTSAQRKEKVQWISFEQLEDSLRKAPKKVFVDFYTKWCTYCRKMDKEVYVKPNVAELLNTTYYAVKMDAETRDTIHFDGRIFVNASATKRRKGTHDLAMLLGQRGGRFTPPTMLILDEEFKIQNRYFEYLTSDRLLEALE